MSWPLLGSTPIASIRLHNPVLGVDYPMTGEMNVVVDTGFEGFLLLPWEIFREAGFAELKPIHTMLIGPEGKRFDSKGAYGSIEFPALGKEAEGIIDSSRGAKECLLGVQGLEGLVLEVDSCQRESRLRLC